MNKYHDTIIDISSIHDDMILNMVGPKLHCMRITESKLNYHGSISIDAAILRKASLLPGEFVNVWNKNSGVRLSTYILPAEDNSRICCLNGAAARSCQVGDEVIVTANEKFV